MCIAHRVAWKEMDVRKDRLASMKEQSMGGVYIYMYIHVVLEGRFSFDSVCMTTLLSEISIFRVRAGCKVRMARYASKH